MAYEHSDKIQRLRTALESLYHKYNRFELIKPDPLQFVYRYFDRRDMEVVGFISAIFAYGRVQQIEANLERLFKKMGKSPFDFIINFDISSRKRLDFFKYRFNTHSDICNLIMALGDVLRQSGTLENHFLKEYDDSDPDIIKAASAFCNSLLDRCIHNGRISRGLKFLLANPSGPSASKRLNLFLRWMIRDDDVDTGLWKSIPPSKLLVPVDVHMARLCKFLGLYKKRTVSLSTVIDITHAFSQIEPADPAKYDFALSRVGIMGLCSGAKKHECRNCELSGLCSESCLNQNVVV